MAWPLVCLASPRAEREQYGRGEVDERGGFDGGLSWERLRQVSRRRGSRAADIETKQYGKEYEGRVSQEEHREGQ